MKRGSAIFLLMARQRCDLPGRCDGGDGG